MITLTKTAAFTIENKRISIHPQHKVLVREDGYVLTRNGWKKGSKRKDGYLVVWVNGQNRYAHVLVAEAFLDNNENKPTVDHINRMRDQNNIDNLRFATVYEQNNNTSLVERRMDFGVRACDDRSAYNKAYQQYYRELKKARAEAQA